jgi:hypothetical protein
MLNEYLSSLNRLIVDLCNSLPETNELYQGVNYSELPDLERSKKLGKNRHRYAYKLYLGLQQSFIDVGTPGAAQKTVQHREEAEEQ